jgi:alpha-tubulin suppressor-like RCC1 family protein
MQPRSIAAAVLLLGTLTALGCHDEPTAPTSPAPSASIASLAAAIPLSFSQVSGGTSSTCAIAADSTAWCWGLNDHGELGTGSFTGPEECPSAIGPFACSTKPVRVATGTRKFRSIARGDFHTCAVTTDFHAWCWGWNGYGQLGAGPTAPRQSAVPLAVAGSHRFRQVDAGINHTCGTTYPDNRIFCWGENGWGQLGDGTFNSRSVPVATLGGLTVSRVVAGKEHSCAVTSTNVAYCWGSNDHGQLGDSTVAHRARPVKVVGGHAFRQIDAGYFHTCAVTTGARLFCWGGGGHGQIGDGKTDLSFSPRAVLGHLSVGRVTTGLYHTCAETLTKRAYCWGDNTYGQIGNGQKGVGSKVLSPVAVVGGLLVGQMSAGAWHTCAKTTAGKGYCWGNDAAGQLGDGHSGTDVASPVPVAAPQ